MMVKFTNRRTPGTLVYLSRNREFMAGPVRAGHAVEIDVALNDQIDAHRYQDPKTSELSKLLFAGSVANLVKAGFLEKQEVGK